MLTYGDGLSDIDLNGLLTFHKKQGKLATLTSIQLPGRFGHLNISEDGSVEEFKEKFTEQDMWINGGFFVLDPGVRDFLIGNNTSFESTSLPKLTEKNQLASFEHNGFWHPMDTLREKNLLSAMVQDKTLPWTKYF
jgi:glucose-1-phosphate cytidylyltransferase